MSEHADEKPTEQSNESETPEVGLIPDEDLPEDLQPEENPLAANPDDADDSGSGSDGGSEEPKVDGMPDMGQPG